MSKPRPLRVTLTGGGRGAQTSMRAAIGLLVTRLGGRVVEENFRTSRFELHGERIVVFETNAKKKVPAR